MKRVFRNSVRFVVGFDLVWLLVSALVRLAKYMEFERRRHVEARASELALSALGQSLVVRSGAFKGLVYPFRKSAGSTFLPKLLGCYEMELHSHVEMFCSKQYDLIIDVGCAEGYYAVGLATRFPGIKVIAFDIDADARALCGAFASANGVADRVIIECECTPSTLLEVIAEQRCLIVLDCEGYEHELFSALDSESVAKCDLIIEVHDFDDRRTSELISSRFADTHQLTVVRSLRTDTKATLVDDTITEEMTSEQKRAIVSEKRPNQMDWFVLTSRTVSSPQGATC